MGELMNGRPLAILESSLCMRKVFSSGLRFGMKPPVSRLSILVALIGDFLAVDFFIGVFLPLRLATNLYIISLDES